jgi:cardiolipin synthase
MTWTEHMAWGWQYFVAALTLVLSLLAGGHALLYKRDTGGVVLWMGFVWLVPLVGAVLYFVFGVNRIKRRAMLLRGNLERYRAAPSAPPCPVEALAKYVPAEASHLRALAEVVDKVGANPRSRE